MATPAQNAALEKKALAAETKSAGMRMLLEAGRTVVEVKEIFGAPYGFVYGVAVRAGLVDATPRAEKAPSKAKAPAKAAAKATPAKAASKAKAAPAKPARAAAKPAAKTPARTSKAK